MCIFPLQFFRKKFGACGGRACRTAAFRREYARGREFGWEAFVKNVLTGAEKDLGSGGLRHAAVGLDGDGEGLGSGV